MDLRTVLLDRTSEPELKRIAYEVFVPGYEHGRIEIPRMAYEEFENILWSRPNHVGEGILALRGDEPVGMGGLLLPQRDNRESAMFMVAVHPDHRRHGAGSLLLSVVMDRARHHGRRTLVTECGAPPETIDSVPGVGFAKAKGFETAITNVVRRIRLPVPDESLASLEARTATSTEGYRLESWIDVCPEEYVDQYAELCAALSTDAPQGDLALEPEVWDAERVRARERHNRKSGATTYTSVAVAPDGGLAGHTLVTVSRDHGGVGFQDDTLVRAEHRGHRLGLALKVANLREIQRARSDLRAIRTQNADENAAMIRVNEQLGFEPIEIVRVLQRVL